MSGRPTHWILTGSPENFEATRQRGFRLVGLKEGRRRLAEQVERGDLVVFYLTRIQAFGAISRIVGEMFEDRTPVWPGKPGRADPYPWRFPAEPVLVLEEPRWVPAEKLAPELEHVRKWPAEHWKLAFQGQFRPVSPADGALLEHRLADSARATPVGA